MAALMLAVAGMAWAEDDTTPPEVIRTTPIDGRTGFDRDANIKAKFSEKIRAYSFGFAIFRLYRGNFTYADINCSPDALECSLYEPLSPPPQSVIHYHRQRMTATLDWGERLAANTTYTVVMEGAGDTDHFALRDRAGNEMARDYIWHFTTGGS